MAAELLTCFGPIGIFVAFFAFILILMSIKIIYQYDRGIVFTLGKFDGIRDPGLRFIIPILQTMRIVDIRIKTVDIPKQEVITKDNVPLSVNAVIYFRVLDPKKAVLEIQDYLYAVSQYGQTALRDVIGGISLDFFLAERQKVADSIKTLVDKETDAWGIDVTAIKIQQVELPTDMKRMMARQAEAEREKRAVVIKSEGELKAAENLSKAAERLGKTPGALHLRTLHTIADVSSDQSNTLVFVTPVEVLRAMEGLIKKKGSGKGGA